MTGAFAHYPTPLLADAGLAQIVLCREIEKSGPFESAGVADLEGHRMLVSFHHLRDEAPVASHAETVVHHELFHLLEEHHWPGIVDHDVEWSNDNAPGFEYGKADTARRGFVNDYATSNEVEDRASVFQYLMTRPQELCGLAATDRVLRAKVELIWRRVAEIGGDALLLERAPCVDWVITTSRARRAPPAR